MSKKHILEYMNSFLNLTPGHLEIIIINYGSSDNTLDILKSIQNN